MKYWAEHVLETDSALRGLLAEGDINILDRGFRDAVELLEKRFKLQVVTSALLSKDEKKFKPEQANKSRLCTKIRWVIETINGMIKKLL